MPKKTAPMITHAEILCLAIRAIDADLTKWHNKYDQLFGDHKQVDHAFHFDNARLLNQRAALCTLYQFETGTNYD